MLQIISISFKNSIEFQRLTSPCLTSLQKSICSKGFTLVEVMLAVVILGGISLGVMHLMKQTLTIQVSSNNSSSYQQFRSDLELILRKQSHCNANFRSKPLGTNIPISTSTNGIFTCQPGGGDCLNSSSAQLKIPAQNISWLQGDTRLADRLRMTNVTYTYNPHATNYERGLLDLTITIEEKKYLV